MTDSRPAPAYVALLKFGTRYGPDYVNRLARAVSSNLSRPHQVVCMTDDATGLDPAIRPLPIPDFGPPRERWAYRGNWPKIGLFAPGTFEDDALILYLDLDVMIFDALDPFFERVERLGGLHELREWNPTLLRLLPVALRPDRGGQGSILVWRAREQHHVYTHFKANWEAVQDNAGPDGPYFGQIAWRQHYLPVGWTASFKRHCLGYTPLGFGTTTAKRPEWARVLVFHGEPRPAELVEDGDYRWGGSRRRGQGPVTWVQDYWRRYS
jgi:hypothetical protein